MKKFGVLGPKRKKFGGKYYDYFTYDTVEASAQKAANRMRANAYHVRVVEGQGIGSNGKKFRLYILYTRLKFRK